MSRKKIQIVIERSSDLFSAYAENVEGVYGSGETVAEAKASIEKSIKLLLKYNKKEILPDLLKKKYDIVYRFDVESLLNYYKGIFTNAALERMTGINQKQLQHYASGLKKPRETQIKKIETALHNLGEELMAVAL
jgi:predicted RNase H-like HicB family nuclease